jgi:hypothetical protein
MEFYIRGPSKSTDIYILIYIGIIEVFIMRGGYINCYGAKKACEAPV